MSLPQHQNATLPQFAIDYAPLVWLDSQEQYMPSDLASQLLNTRPEINYTVIAGAPEPLTLDNLNSLNQYSNVFLTSLTGIASNPPFLRGVKPSATGETVGATSCAIVTVPHLSDSTILDVFYFYFYAYNQGNWVFGSSALELGDHVSDWEHTMVRFVNGEPQAIWLSQHAYGEAFTYNATEKSGVRPVVYSARGSHANYATAGTHAHTFYNLNTDVGPIEDHCSKGTLWDPVLSAFEYSYAPSSGVFSPYSGTEPVNWLYFSGAWGDKQVPDSDPAQRDFFGNRKYVSGPVGPQYKGLVRQAVCPSVNDCIVRTVLTS